VILIDREKDLGIEMMLDLKTQTDQEIETNYCKIKIWTDLMDANVKGLVMLIKEMSEVLEGIERLIEMTEDQLELIEK